MLTGQLYGLGSSPSGKYRIGPSDFFTPGDLEADAKVLDGQMQALDAVVSANSAIPASWLASWKSFKTAWDAFNGDHFSGWFSSFGSALNDSNRDELIRYEDQFEQWLSDAGGYASSLPAGSVTVPSTGSGDTLSKQLDQQLGTDNAISKIAWIAGGVAALWFGFQVYKETRGR